MLSTEKTTMQLLFVTGTLLMIIQYGNSISKSMNLRILTFIKERVFVLTTFMTFMIILQTTHNITHDFLPVGRRPTNDGARSRSPRSRFMRAHEPYLPGSLPHTTLWHQHILAYLKVRQYISNASLQACFSKTRSLSFGSLIWKCHSTGQMWRFK